MSGTELVLLDLDGCLIDSTDAITGSIRHALTEVGIDAPPADALRWCIGPPLLESLTQLLASAEADVSLATRCLDHYRDHYRTWSPTRTRVIAGIPEAMAAMAESARLAVVTSKPGPAAVPLIEHLGLAERLAAVHAPQADHRVEHKAVTLARALADLAPGADPAAAVMVGDRSHDVVAGLACGTGTIGVSWGAGDRAELAEAGAHQIVEHPHQLAAAVLSR
jgi:phosphoglycolate phosphatase